MFPISSCNQFCNKAWNISSAKKYMAFNKSDPTAYLLYFDTLFLRHTCALCLPVHNCYALHTLIGWVFTFILLLTFVIIAFYFILYKHCCISISAWRHKNFWFQRDLKIDVPLRQLSFKIFLLNFVQKKIYHHNKY